jgi:hypothetical protein
MGVLNCTPNHMLRFEAPVGEKVNGFGTEKQYQINYRVQTLGNRVTGIGEVTSDYFYIDGISLHPETLYPKPDTLSQGFSAT